MNSTNKVKQVEGDLLQLFREGHFLAVFHVVNCQGVMGSGIAKQIKEEFPRVYTEYKSKCDLVDNGRKLMGHYDIVWCENGYIVNLYAQNYYGISRKHLEEDYLEEALKGALKSLKARSGVFNKNELGFPVKMGSDRAGGDWNVVKGIIEDIVDDNGITYVLFKR